VRDCGIELTVIPADTPTVLAPIWEYPHIPGGYEEPFEAVFLGWLHGFDPHDELWHSRSASSAEQPAGLNFMGFSNPRVDELLEQGLGTYDQRERARIYRELQVVLAEERPVLFGWASRIQEALDARIGLTDGELNLSSRQWFWQLEKLVLRDGQDGVD
jgi:ABC-type transport system substrate-binding protein